MKIAVRYYSRTGNTKKLATAISDVLSVRARTVNIPLTEDVDILFLGSPVYAGGVPREIKAFFKKNKVHIGTIVNFNTAALQGSNYKQVKKLSERYGIHMCSREFHCKGSFGFINSSHPDPIDRKEAAAFTLDTVEHIRKHIHYSNKDTKAAD